MMRPYRTTLDPEEELLSGDYDIDLDVHDFFGDGAQPFHHETPSVNLPEDFRGSRAEMYFKEGMAYPFYGSVSALHGGLQKKLGITLPDQSQNKFSFEDAALAAERVESLIKQIQDRYEHSQSWRAQFKELTEAIAAGRLLAQANIKVAKELMRLDIYKIDTFERLIDNGTLSYSFRYPREGSNIEFRIQSKADSVDGWLYDDYVKPQLAKMLLSSAILAKRFGALRAVTEQVERCSGETYSCSGAALLFALHDNKNAAATHSAFVRAVESPKLTEFRQYKPFTEDFGSLWDGFFSRLLSSKTLEIRDAGNYLSSKKGLELTDLVDIIDSGKGIGIRVTKKGEVVDFFKFGPDESPILP